MSNIKQRPSGPGLDHDSIEDVDLIEGSLDAIGQRYAVIITEWNEAIISGLLQGALSTLIDCGAAADNIDVIRVPGAFELAPVSYTHLTLPTIYSV